VTEINCKYCRHQNKHTDFKKNLFGKRYVYWNIQTAFVIHLS